MDVGDEVDDFSEHSMASDDTSDEGSEDGEEEEEDDDETMAENPECLCLAMPSSLGRERVVHLGLETLAMQELELQKGQANDTLEGLWLALGHKALLW